MRRLSRAALMVELLNDWLQPQEVRRNKSAKTKMAKTWPRRKAINYGSNIVKASIATLFHDLSNAEIYFQPMRASQEIQ